MQGRPENMLERALTLQPGDPTWALPHLFLITSPATLGLRVLTVTLWFLPYSSHEMERGVSPPASCPAAKLRECAGKKASLSLGVQWP